MWNTITFDHARLPLITERHILLKLYITKKEIKNYQQLPNWNLTVVREEVKIPLNYTWLQLDDCVEKKFVMGFIHQERSVLHKVVTSSFICLCLYTQYLHIKCKVNDDGLYTLGVMFDSPQLLHLLTLCYKSIVDSGLAVC